MRWSPVTIAVLSVILLTSCQKVPAIQIKVDKSGTAPIEVESSGKEVTASVNFAYMTPAAKRLLLLEDFLVAYSREHKLGNSVSYLYNFADLNGDGDNEILVSLHLNKEKSGQLRLIVASDYKTLLGELPGSGPLIVTTKKEKEWSILALYDGDGVYKTAKFQNKQYIWVAMSKENVIQFTEISGTAYLSDEELFAGFTII